MVKFVVSGFTLWVLALGLGALVCRVSPECVYRVAGFRVHPGFSE